jgi:hypothetical protein
MIEEALEFVITDNPVYGACIRPPHVVQCAIRNAVRCGASLYIRR